MGSEATWSHGRFAAAALSLMLALGASGCSISAADSLDGATNRCVGANDCVAGGVCNAGMCVAMDADLTGLYLQTDIPNAAAYAAGASALASLSSGEFQFFGERADGWRHGADVVVPAIAAVTGAVSVPSDNPQPACSDLIAADASLPVTMELYPAVAAAALPLPTYQAASSPSGGSHAVTLGVPAGNYDVYLVPQIPHETEEDRIKYADCHMPPTILPSRQLDVGQVAIGVTLATPSKLVGTITGFNLDGWRVQLLDNDRGRALSASKVLTTGAGNQSAFELYYWDQLVAQEQVDALLRLQPPADAGASAMPTILWKLAAVDLDGDNTIALDIGALGNADAAAVKVTGVVNHGGVGVPATVVVQSDVLLQGELGGNAYYRHNVATAADGSYSAVLLPGRYAVTALPSSEASGYAITSTILEVNSETLGAGQDIEVNPRSRLEGTILTPDGAPGPNINAWLQPAAVMSATYLQAKLAPSAVPPSGSSTVTNANGRFNVAVDPGTYDLSTRPAAGAGLPWLVLPRVAIVGAEQPASAQLGELMLSYPVVVEGVVRSPDGIVLPNTLVRAWLPTTATDNAEEAAPSVIQIAETVSDAAGRYRLLLPASVSE